MYKYIKNISRQEIETIKAEKAPMILFLPRVVREPQQPILAGAPPLSQRISGRVLDYDFYSESGSLAFLRVTGLKYELTAAGEGIGLMFREVFLPSKSFYFPRRGISNEMDHPSSSNCIIMYNADSTSFTDQDLDIFRELDKHLKGLEGEQKDE